MQTVHTSLFGDLQLEEPAKDIDRRRKAMNKCLEAQSDAFRTAYREFALNFAIGHEPFLAEEIRFEYLKTKLPRPHSKNKKDAWKSTGGIIHKLLKDGLLKYYCVDGVRQYKWTKGGERQMPLLMKG